METKKGIGRKEGIGGMGTDEERKRRTGNLGGRERARKGKR